MKTKMISSIFSNHNSIRNQVQEDNSKIHKYMEVKYLTIETKLWVKEEIKRELKNILRQIKM